MDRFQTRPPGWPPAVVEEHQLDDELARVEAYLLSLRRQKNVRALVSRLPIEVLAHIFSFFSASNSLPHTLVSSPPPWLAVTHVCQRWRATALSFPRLWTNIITSNASWMKEMILRSKHAPLYIMADRDVSDTLRLPLPKHDVVTSVLAYTSRAHTIELRTSMVHRYLKVLCASPAPFLEKLVLEDRNSKYRLPADPLPFLGETPKLRELCLRRVEVVWPCSLIQTSLVYLELSHFRPRHRPTVAQLRDALWPLKNLETLIIDHALPVQSPDATASTLTLSAAGTVAAASRVDFLSIKYVKLVADSGMDILGFTVGAIFPVNATVVFVSEVLFLEPVQSAAIGAILAALCSLYQLKFTPSGQLHAMIPYKSLRINDFGADKKAGWQLCVGGERFDGSDPQHAPLPPGPFFEPRVTVHLRWENSSRGRRHSEFFFKAACQFLPLHQIETLAVDCDLFSTPDTWLDAFGRLTRVKTVLARGKATRGLIDALSQPVTGSGLLSDADLSNIVALTYSEFVAHPSSIFPQLSDLSICRTSLDAISLEEPETESLFKALLGGLSGRWKDPKPDVRRVKRLSVKECDMDEEQRKELLECIEHDEVEWDGDRHGYTRLAAALAALQPSDDEDEENIMEAAPFDG